MLKSVLAGAVLVAALATSTANAVVLYDNLGVTPCCSDGASNPILNGAGEPIGGGVGPLYASFSTQGSPFSLSNFNVLVNGGGIDIGTYYIAIYADNGSTAPGALLYKSGNFNDIDLPNDPNVVNFSFAPIALAANSRYWISLGSVGDSELIWHFSFDLIGTTGVAGEFWKNAVGDGSNVDGAYLMQISSSEVPLPAALPLFATILAGGGLIAWRRKRKAAATATA